MRSQKDIDNSQQPFHYA